MLLIVVSQKTKIIQLNKRNRRRRPNFQCQKINTMFINVLSFLLLLFLKGVDFSLVGENITSTCSVKKIDQTAVRLTFFLGGGDGYKYSVITLFLCSMKKIAMIKVKMYALDNFRKRVIV